MIYMYIRERYVYVGDNTWIPPPHPRDKNQEADNTSTTFTI